MSAHRTTRLSRLLPVLLGCGLLAGCATTGSRQPDAYYAVTASQTQVFRFGPAQPTGADAILSQGQRVKMLRREYGYSRVMTEDGEAGYVANDHIAPAPPPEKPVRRPSWNPFANLPPLPSRGTSMPGVSSANRAILQSDPLFGGSDLPPLPDSVDGADHKLQSGSPKSRPGFRVTAPAPRATPPEIKRQE